MVPGFALVVNQWMVPGQPQHHGYTNSYERVGSSKGTGYSEQIQQEPLNLAQHQTLPRRRVCMRPVLVAADRNHKTCTTLLAKQNEAALCMFHVVDYYYYYYCL